MKNFPIAKNLLRILSSLPVSIVTFLSIFVIILSNFDFKIIKDIKLGINEIIYRSSFLISIPENKIKKINIQINNHTKMYNDYESIKLELENFKQKEKKKTKYLNLYYKSI